MATTRRGRWGRGAGALAIAVLGTGCDQGSKAWVERSLADDADGTRVVVDPHVDIVLSYNHGTAFSLVGDLGTTRVVLGAFALVAGVVLVALAARARTRLWTVGLAVVAAGAVGNGLDRVFRTMPEGGTAVVDFVRVNLPWGGSWPTFNVADVMVTVGAALALLASARDSPPSPAAGPSSPAG